jgi:hypothetical protein
MNAPTKDIYENENAHTHTLSRRERERERERERLKVRECAMDLFTNDFLLTNSQPSNLFKQNQNKATPGSFSAH